MLHAYVVYGDAQAIDPCLWVLKNLLSIEFAKNKKLTARPRPVGWLIKAVTKSLKIKKLTARNMSTKRGGRPCEWGVYDCSEPIFEIRAISFCVLMPIPAKLNWPCALFVGRDDRKKIVMRVQRCIMVHEKYLLH